MEKDIKKVKLIYSGELIVIAIVFLVIGFLELFKIMNISDNLQLIFKIITLVGASWITFDFIWTITSPKKRAKNSLMDKIMLLPAALYLFVFDIVGFVSPRPYEYYQIGMPLIFFYIACAYIFQGIYHYYHPTPMVILMIEEAKQEALKKQQDKNDSAKEDNPLQEGNEDNPSGESNESNSSQEGSESNPANESNESNPTQEGNDGANNEF